MVQTKPSVGGEVRSHMQQGQKNKTFLVFLSTNSIVCVISGSASIDYLLIMSCIFLILFMPDNFRLDTRYFNFTLLVDRVFKNYIFNYV